jgi:L,D-peptidoglycan transpeptidase YkuD (ErfK/YbiS/YcfS/YnhG family)
MRSIAAALQGWRKLGRLVVLSIVTLGSTTVAAGSVAAAAGGQAGPAATAAPAVLTNPRTTVHCPVNLADGLKSTRSARQLVTVNSVRAASTYAVLNTWKRSGACWVRVAGPFTARVGDTGISTHKVEGDGATPAGAFWIGSVMYGNAKNPGVQYPYHRFVCGDWWDEDPASRWYNEFKHIACGSRPAWTYVNSEALWTETTAYQSFAFIKYNTDPVVPGRGSAIFLHDNIGAPTVGCVSLAPARLDSVLDWMRPSDRPLIVIGTDENIRSY